MIVEAIFRFFMLLILFAVVISAGILMLLGWIEYLEARKRLKWEQHLEVYDTIHKERFRDN